MRHDILDILHEGHVGVTKCKVCVSMSAWWPGIGKNIESFIASCHHCAFHRPTQRNELLKPTPLPDRPWQRVASELLEIKEKEKQMFYMVVIDCYSRYLEIL